MSGNGVAGHDATGAISKASLEFAAEALRRDRATDITPEEIEELNSNYDCFGAMVVVSKLAEREEISEGGIVKAKRIVRTQDAVVVMAGPGEWMPNGTFVPCEFKPGQKVVITKFGGTNMDLDGHELLLLHMKQVYLGEKVSAKIGKHEEIQGRPEMQQYLTSIFGVNPFGEPLFRLIWGSTETYDVAAPYGGGYVKKYIGHGEPCWSIQRWRAPEVFGTPDLYYSLMADPTSGLPLAGEYPQFGFYDTVVSLMSRVYDAETGALEIQALQLDWELIERAVPMLVEAEQLTETERLAALEAIEAAENAEIVSQIAERMQSELPTFYGPVSHANRHVKTSVLQRKMDQIEKFWRENPGHKPRKGFFQENT